MKATLHFRVILFFLWGIAGTSVCFSQSSTYKAIIKDSISQKTLSGVRIYSDNEQDYIESDLNGKFEFQIKEGSTLRFRKAGYQWFNLTIKKQNPKNIEMKPSPQSNELQDKITAIEVNGKPLPKEEWNDINPDYITEIAILELDENKNKLVIKTK